MNAKITLIGSDGKVAHEQMFVNVENTGDIIFRFRPDMLVTEGWKIILGYCLRIDAIDAQDLEKQPLS